MTGIDSQEDKLLVSRAEDAMDIAERQYRVKTLGFLNPRQRELIRRSVAPSVDMSLTFDGGYPDAERSMMVCHPEYIFPEREEYLAVLKCTGRDVGRLSHRDYLGSLMGLGIVRESIGDILVFDDRAMIFVRAENAEYILQNITKIGNCGVVVEKCDVSQVEIPEKAAKEITGTVSALRLDSVVSVAAGISRSKSAELIKQGMVTLNWEISEEVSDMLREGDMLSVRGIGRMKLAEVGGITRKGRQYIKILKYI